MKSLTPEQRDLLAQPVVGHLTCDLRAQCIDPAEVALVLRHAVALAEGGKCDAAAHDLAQLLIECADYLQELSNEHGAACGARARAVGQALLATAAPRL